MGLGAALHLLIARIVASQDVKDGVRSESIGSRWVHLLLPLRHSGVRREYQYGTGDFLWSSRWQQGWGVRRCLSYDFMIGASFFFCVLARIRGCCVVVLMSYF